VHRVDLTTASSRGRSVRSRRPPSKRRWSLSSLPNELSREVLMPMRRPMKKWSPRAKPSEPMRAALLHRDRSIVIVCDWIGPADSVCETRVLNRWQEELDDTASAAVAGRSRNLYIQVQRIRANHCRRDKPTLRGCCFQLRLGSTAVGLSKATAIGTAMWYAQSCKAHFTAGMHWATNSKDPNGGILDCVF